MITWLITGGTGTLGSRLVETLIGRGHKVRAFARDEHKHEALIRKLGDHPNLSCLIGDVRDYDRLKFAAKGVDNVIHAAALKIVPLAEYNPMEAVQTNVGGTENLAKVVADNNRIVKAVFVSTDKACHPANLYGATKMTAERLWMASNRYAPHRSPFSCVRYGNVSGSNGSVWQVLRTCKLNNMPFTLTDPDMTRFHIMVRDAVDLVLAASRTNISGLFVPVLRSYRVEDLVEAFGVTDVKVIGKRPGEKIHETLITEDEARHMLETTGMTSGKMEYRILDFNYEGQEFTPFTSERTSITVNELRGYIGEVFGG